MLDIAKENFTAIALVFALFPLSLLCWIAGDPFADIVKTTLIEFQKLLTGSKDNRALNALGLLLMFLIFLVTIWKGPIELIGGTIDPRQIGNFDAIFRACAMVFAIIVVAVFAIISMKMNKQ